MTEIDEKIHTVFSVLAVYVQYSLSSAELIRVTLDLFPIDWIAETINNSKFGQKSSNW